MNLFDKACAVITIPVGAAFLVLGVIGLFTGSSAHFTLPPLLGALPFFLGWGMCVVLVKAWSRHQRMAEKGFLKCPVCGHEAKLTRPGSYNCSSCNAFTCTIERRSR